MKVATIDYLDKNAGKKFVNSISETGFAVMINHPVRLKLIHDIYQNWANFFKDDKKIDYLRDLTTQDGYFPYLSENAKGAVAKDLKEFYHVYPDGRIPENLRKITLEFYDAMFNLSLELLGWLDDYSPQSAKDKFPMPLKEMMVGSRQSLLRILHYPPIEGVPEKGAVRAAAHEDINLITLLVTGSAPGLQARDLQGNWHDVPCDEGMITINSGDMLKLASQQYFPSTTHRVINPTGDGEIKNTSRYSLPMFLHPNPSVYLGEGMTADDYLKKRLAEIGLIKG